MKFISTRSSAPAVSASIAIRAGLAPDGGLYIPETFPQFAPNDFAGVHGLPDIASVLLAPFFAGDPLADHLVNICASAFDFPVPVQAVADKLSVLELFHGPTAAFKDFGARFLANCTDAMEDQAAKQTILVATSGDTGGAVGCAFADSSNARVVILYPRGRVSPFQEQQLTCWGDNVTALEVDGDFDACQDLVKQAFAPQTAKHLGSANSINIARLLPQMSYYAQSALAHFTATGEPANFVIPTGNMGNGMACLWARACGLPIGQVVFASNANRTLFDFFAEGVLRENTSIPTLANAMDVGNPSNFERYGKLLPSQTANTACYMTRDPQIEHRIRQDHFNYGQTWCPHTACAAESWQQLPLSQRDQHWFLVATAHPYKFREVVEPLITQPILAAPALQEILNLPSQKTQIAAQLSALLAHI